MRGVLAAVLMLAALWRAAVDWQATIGQGYAYRLTPLGQVFNDLAPQTYAWVVAGWKNSGWLWDPLGATLLALPFSLVLAVIALLLWISRRRKRSR